MLENVVKRYNRLPKLPIVDKFAYVVWKGLFRRLIARKVVSQTGVLRQPRTPKTPLPLPQTTYKRIICSNGFMWSGSSATADLIGEYANVTEQYGGTRPEFDLVRGAGGLLSLERVLQSQNIFDRDLAIRIFMCFAEHLYINSRSLYGEEFVLHTREFVNKIIDIKSTGKVGVDFCRHVAALGVDGINHILGRPIDHTGEYVFYLKDMSVKDFRRLAAEYLKNIFSALEAKEILLLDQASADFTNDIDRMRDYFGPDMISVYTWRDPRDVYTSNMIARSATNEDGYVPEIPEDFVRWYKHMHRELLGYEHPNLLVIRFEDLILDYENTVKRVEQACRLLSADHVAPKTLFNPAESLAVSVGLWREYSEMGHAQAQAIEYIFNELKEYCYTKPYKIPPRAKSTSTGVTILS